jgi:hypothetical protein
MGERMEGDRGTKEIEEHKNEGERMLKPEGEGGRKQEMIR